MTDQRDGVALGVGLGDWQDGCRLILEYNMVCSLGRVSVGGVAVQASGIEQGGG